MLDHCQACCKIRAEIYAVLRALQLTEGSEERLFLWSDCEGVIKKLKRILSGHDVRINSSHSDLWLEIQMLVRARVGPIFAARVAAHQRNEDAGDIYADWCFRHNGVADRQAVRANLSRSPEFWALWQQHTAACEGIAWYNRLVQQTQLAISKEATREETPLCEVPSTHVLPAAGRTFADVSTSCYHLIRYMNHPIRVTFRTNVTRWSKWESKWWFGT